jgi:arylsulfatase A-like enzyme
MLNIFIRKISWNFMILRNVIFVLLFSASFALNAKQKRNAIDERPNFIFILTDDQPLGYTSIEGNSIVKTPNIDQLAEEGVRFTNAYITSAICTPSRVSIFTSMYERQHGVNFNSGTSLSADVWELAYPVLFRKAGYYTGYIGKNHAPVGEGGYESGLMERSFDYWYAGHGHLGFYPKVRHRIFADARYDTQVEVVAEGVADFLSNEQQMASARKFIKERPADQPFCLSICFNLPHDAGSGTMELRTSDDEIYKTLYRDTEIPLPEHYISKKDIKEPKIPEFIHHYKDRQTGYNYVDQPETVKERLIREYQCMTGIDRMIGALRETLVNNGLDQNTVIIFTSDHGIFKGEFGLGGKALCYQKCIQVPLIIYDPMTLISYRGKVIDELVQSIDIAPTMLSLAGISIPACKQGKDLSPFLNGSRKPVREYVFTENLWSNSFGNPRIEAVQDKEWKYIRYYRNENISSRYVKQVSEELGVPLRDLYRTRDSDIAVYRHYLESSLSGEPAVYEELYCLQKDPDETTNLINDPEHSEVIKRMKRAWWRLLNEARGDGLSKAIRYEKPYPVFPLPEDPAAAGKTGIDKD